MQAETRSALRTLNRRFYQRFADAFSDSRGRPWPGWKRVVDHLAETSPSSVLDAGCGNGRFAHFLARRLTPGWHYVGLDSCRELLDIAARRLEGVAPADFEAFDLLNDDLGRHLSGRHFDLVALFGVLHHVPGSGARRALLASLTQHLRPGGLLAVSIWRFDRSPRFERRRIAWDDYNALCQRAGRPPLPIEQLEPGDVLLSWAGDREHPRYCHFPADDEITDWIASSPVPLLDRFEADGPSGVDNLYLLFRKPLSAEDL
ncbi:MAG: methyltransferase [Acidobacteriota bacterium]